MAKLRLGVSNPTNQFVDFWCPGCNCAHKIVVGNDGPWKLSGSVDDPTISPSILVVGQTRCHSFIRDGRIEFLSDCEHVLASKTVELPDWNG